MDDGQDADLVFRHSVRDDIRRVRDDQFSRASYPAGAAETGMPAELINGNADRRQHARRRVRIVLGDEFANRFEIVECRCTPNDVHPRSWFLRLWPRQLAIGAPGLHPPHDFFVGYGGTARFVLCRFDMGDLPGVEIDVCLDRLARQMRGAAPSTGAPRSPEDSW